MNQDFLYPFPEYHQNPRPNSYVGGDSSEGPSWGEDGTNYLRQKSEANEKNSKSEFNNNPFNTPSKVNQPFGPLVLADDVEQRTLLVSLYAGVFAIMIFKYFTK